MAEAPGGDIIAYCARQCGLSVAEARAIAATAPKRYYVWEIAKRTGGNRTVCHPARELKVLQEVFLRHVLQVLPVHANAMAYVKGSSIKRNAEAHASSRVILKLDFLEFFNNIKVKNWKGYAIHHFPSWTEAELEFSSRILFWGNGTYAPKCLAIGAPTSPLISNAIMFEVDEKLSKYAARSGLVYTRYADDLVFSSRGRLEKDRVLHEVKKVLGSASYSRMRLNNKKTCLVSNRFARKVTGLTITPDHRVSLGRARKRLISAMVHRASKGELSNAEKNRLRGLLAFAQDIEASFVFMLRRKYSAEIVDVVLRWGGES
jgi:hypothetical protein